MNHFIHFGARSVNLAHVVWVRWSKDGNPIDLGHQSYAIAGLTDGTELHVSEVELPQFAAAVGKTDWRIKAVEPLRYDENGRPIRERPQ